MTGLMKYLLLILFLVFGCSPTEAEDVYGCIDDSACNFNAEANILDNSCFYMEDCNGECPDDFIGEWKGIGEYLNFDNIDCAGEGSILLDITNQIYTFNTTHATLSYTDTSHTVLFDINCSINSIRFASNQDDVIYTYAAQDDIVTFTKFNELQSECKRWSIQKIE